MFRRGIKKSKLQKVIEKLTFTSEFDIDHQLSADNNITYFRVFHVKRGDAILWVEGYGERSHFFLEEYQVWNRRSQRYFTRLRAQK